jgi:hypothetical protein
MEEREEMQGKTGRQNERRTALTAVRRPGLVCVVRDRRNFAVIRSTSKEHNASAFERR